MNDSLDTLWALVQSERGIGFLEGLFLIIVGFVVARLASATTSRLLRGRIGQQGAILARRLVFYGLFLLFVVSGLREAGFDLSVLLGAAGVLTVALGFASQTSVSNIISGLFLIGERAFEVGESIIIGEVTGEVLAVDWMSVKLRTFDNLMVRLPNEMVLKSQITNLSRFPIRRFDHLLKVAFGSDLEQVKAVLMRVAHENPLCLDEPKPILFHKGFGESTIQLQFSTWFLTPNGVEFRNRLPQEIAEALAEEGIALPVPQSFVTWKGIPDSVQPSVAVETVAEPAEPPKA